MPGSPSDSPMEITGPENQPLLSTASPGSHSRASSVDGEAWGWVPEVLVQNVGVEEDGRESRNSEYGQNWGSPEGNKKHPGTPSGVGQTCASPPKPDVKPEEKSKESICAKVKAFFCWFLCCCTDKDAALASVIVSDDSKQNSSSSPSRRKSGRRNSDPGVPNSFFRTHSAHGNVWDTLPADLGTVPDNHGGAFGGPTNG